MPTSRSALQFSCGSAALRYRQFTEMDTVPSVCIVETPAPLAWMVILTTTGVGGEGDGDEPPPPPQLDAPRISHVKLIRMAVQAANRPLPRHHLIVTIHPTASVKIKSQSVPKRPGGCGHCQGGAGGEAAGMLLTCTVSVSDTLPLAGSVGAEGLKAQVVPLGRPAHCKFTVPAAPFWELTVTVKLADCPTVMLAEVGETLPLRPGGTCTWTVADTVWVSEPLVAVTENG